jgi:hypothetical protein
MLMMGDRAVSAVPLGSVTVTVLASVLMVPAVPLTVRPVIELGGGGGPPPPPPDGLEQDMIQRIRAVMIGKRRKLLNR